MSNLSRVATSFVLALAAVSSASCGQSANDGPRPPALLVNRAWFDELPKDQKTKMHAAVFTEDGIGLTYDGSAHRYTIDMFEFKRSDNKVAIKLLQDDQKIDTKFAITNCNVKAPFDLCLDFTTPVGGLKRYYGIEGDGDEATRAFLKTARARLVEAKE